MTETGHALGIHITSGVLHCASCNVTLWDDQLENIWNFSKKTSSLSCPFINRLQAVEETIGYAPSKNSLFVKICPGIRGLYNLGNTCYMNSTLQILLNSPLLKRFFLSPSYPPHPNVPTAAGVNKRLAKCPLSHAPSSNTRNNHECIACEFDSLLVEMNSIYGDTQKMAKAPISPHRLLTALWKASPNEFAGYAQRDAHEFLVALRSIFHTHCGGTAFNCKCIVHTLFSGVLKSDITCLECGGVAETLDPFLDLSLDIPSKSSMLGTLNMYSMSSSMSENSPFDDSKKNKIVSLENCLEKFTRQERLQSDGYTCRICRSTQQEILKRLSLPAASLPSILTIQIKRFKHLSNTTASSLKIDTPVSFPLVLDMSPYTGSFSSAISHAGLQDIEFDVSKNHQDEQRRRKYHLYGLICHIGSLDSGHYTAYIRKSEMSWFLIDDASVTLVSWEIVQSLPTAYMLFYTV